MSGLSVQASDRFAQNYVTGNKKKNSSFEQTEEEKKEISELKKRDQEVRSHEMAHMAAGGGYIRGGASYSFQSGPDGQRYAVGGEVSIDTAPVKGDPAATIQKMQVVRRAALSPASPSGQDRSVAAAASAVEAQARQKMDAQRSGETKTGTGNSLTKQYKNDGKAQIIDLEPPSLDTMA